MHDWYLYKHGHLHGLSSSTVKHLYLANSLVPRPPSFLPSVCVHNNTREQKTGEKRARSGSIDHVSGCEVDVGGLYSNQDE